MLLSGVGHKNVRYYLHSRFHMFVFSYVLFQNIRSQMFFKLGVFKNCAIFTGKHLCLLNKVADLKATNFIKKRLQHKVFSVNIAKFLRIPFFIEHLVWLVLLFEVISLTCYSEAALFI